jgi:probable addiction module antidote protein
LGKFCPIAEFGINQLKILTSKKLKSWDRNTYKQSKMEVTRFNISDYLDDDEMIQEYLNTILKEADPKDILVALGHIAKAIGMSKIAEQTGMSRPSLYKALSENAKPQFETILKVIRAIGGNLKVNVSAQ